MELGAGSERRPQGCGQRVDEDGDADADAADGGSYSLPKPCSVPSPLCALITLLQSRVYKASHIIGTAQCEMKMWGLLLKKKPKTQKIQNFPLSSLVSLLTCHTVFHVTLSDVTYSHFPHHSK